MDNSPIKQIGLCTECEKPVFDILKRYPQSHPLAGRVRQVGSPNEDAMRVTFVLPNGNQIDVTFCRECYDLSPENVRKAWYKIMNTWVEENSDEHRLNLNTKPLTKEQKETTDKWMIEMANVFPVVLHALPWSDYA